MNTNRSPVAAQDWALWEYAHLDRVLGSQEKVTDLHTNAHNILRTENLGRFEEDNRASLLISAGRPSI